MEPDRAIGVRTGDAQDIEASVEAEATAGAASVRAGATAGAGAGNVEAAAASTGAGAANVEAAAASTGAAMVEAKSRAEVRGTDKVTRHVRAQVEAGTKTSALRWIDDVMRRERKVARSWGRGVAVEAELMQSRALTTAKRRPERFYGFHNRISSCNSRAEVQKLLKSKVTEKAMLIECEVTSETNIPAEYNNLLASFLLYMENFTLHSLVNDPPKGDEAAAATGAGAFGVGGSVSSVNVRTHTREGVSGPAGAAVVEAEARAEVHDTEEAARRVREQVEAGRETRLTTGIGNVARRAGNVAGPWGREAAVEAVLMQARALTTARRQPERFYGFHHRVSSCNSRAEVQNLLKDKVTERAMLIENEVTSETNSPAVYNNLLASFLLYLDNFTLHSPVNRPCKGDDVLGQTPPATAASASDVPRPLSIPQPRHPSPTTIPLPHPIPAPAVLVRPVAQRALPRPRQHSPDVLLPPPASPPLGAEVHVDLTLSLRPPAPYDPQNPSN